MQVSLKIKIAGGWKSGTAAEGYFDKSSRMDLVGGTDEKENDDRVLEVSEARFPNSPGSESLDSKHRQFHLFSRSLLLRRNNLHRFAIYFINFFLTFSFNSFWNHKRSKTASSLYIHNKNHCSLQYESTFFHLCVIFVPRPAGSARKTHAWKKVGFVLVTKIANS